MGCCLGGTSWRVLRASQLFWAIFYLCSEAGNTPEVQRSRGTCLLPTAWCGTHPAHRPSVAFLAIPCRGSPDGHKVSCVLCPSSRGRWPELLGCLGLPCPWWWEGLHQLCSTWLPWGAPGTASEGLLGWRWRFSSQGLLPTGLSPAGAGSLPLPMTPSTSQLSAQPWFPPAQHPSSLLFSPHRHLPTPQPRPQLQPEEAFRQQADPIPPLLQALS